MNQPTFDMSVLRSALDSNRTGHEDAIRLLELAAAGVIEIAVPPQGARADLDGDMATPLAEQVLDLLGAPGVIELSQLAVPSDVTFPSATLFPDTPVEGFAEAWQAVDADWNGPGHKPGTEDRWYVESHIARGRDVLVTDDRGMRTMCQRLSTEYGIPVTALSLAEYAALFPQQASTPNHPSSVSNDGRAA